MRSIKVWAIERKTMICAIFGHKRDSHRTWYDGLDWRSNCKRCDEPLLKDARMQKWRPFDREQDFDERRSGKPDRIDHAAE